ncbi:hypothetical protein [Chitinophaga alhagiae]|nr:hypothetical protein [Chitinophaga alhagiae]
MLKNQARTLGLIAIAVSGITIASCSKNEEPDKVYRSKEYPLKDKANAAAGKVTVQETSDSTFRLTIRLDKSTKDTSYTFAILKGSTGTPTSDTAFAMRITSQTTGAPVDAKFDRIDSIQIDETHKQKFTYDSLLKYQAFVNVTFKDLEDVAAPKDSLVAIGNIGKSAQ